ncbi:hypothetical protein HPB51_007276 [Rhipicephalus microplus]|uniref:THAP-type domain-containing protein n=1 Tax=Rhipicephalus microplus TaxID=6941 RepID=A0A9J6EYY2_RHIMP|nr:hypothetical protein HPB51_007276 [Rhipicephalus microplus]
MDSVEVQQDDGSVEELAVQPPPSGVDYPARPPQLLQRAVMKWLYLQERHIVREVQNWKPRTGDTNAGATRRAQDMVGNIEDAFKRFLYAMIGIGDEVYKMTEQRISKMAALIGYPDGTPNSSDLNDYYGTRVRSAETLLCRVCIARSPLRRFTKHGVDCSCKFSCVTANAMESGVKKKKKTQTHFFAPGCSSGYVSSRRSGQHQVLDASSRICELHFDEQYIVRSFTHTINGVTVTTLRDRPGLTSDVIPTVFPNLPQYLSKKAPQKRKSKTSTCGLPVKSPRHETSNAACTDEVDVLEERSASP